MGAIVQTASYQSPLKSHSFYQEAGDTAAFITLVPSMWGLTCACLAKTAAAVCIFLLYWDVLLHSVSLLGSSGVAATINYPHKAALLRLSF